MTEPLLPCDLRVHHATFHKGVKVSTAQASIDRLSAELKRLQKGELFGLNGYEKSLLTNCTGHCKESQGNDHE